MIPRSHLASLDFRVPRKLIRQHPTTVRDACRLMVVDRASGKISHHRFSDLRQLLCPGDLLVLNDTKVIPARIFGQRPSGGRVEMLLLRTIATNRWVAMLKPAAKVVPGMTLAVAPALRVTILAKRADGIVVLRLRGTPTVAKALHRIGHIPLPPYIRRPDTWEDRINYQTVFARKAGAVAAPTAGLHFTIRLLMELRAQGVRTATVTLHVGLGTFQPLGAEQLRTGRLHPERFAISHAAADAIARTQRNQQRVVAVGTTVVRALEHTARQHRGHATAGKGETNLLIAPGFRFQVVDALITNFHLPQSSLLLLVYAFAGRTLARQAYRVAVQRRYGFYSYGDAMLII